jgi:methyl-accepting chemotaxis protein
MATNVCGESSRCQQRRFDGLKNEELAMNSKAQKSLAQVVVVYAALVIAAGMAVYAAFQYIMTPNRTVMGLLVEHMWHVVALGVFMYVVLSAVLVRKVVQPIHSLYLRCYAITRGDFSRISVESDVLEIQEIADGMNMMLDRIDKSMSETSLSDLSGSAQDLRALAKEPNLSQESTRERLLQVALKIDEVVAMLTSSALRSGE